MLTAEMGEAAAMASRLRNTPDVDLARDLDPAFLTDYLDDMYAKHRADAVKLCDRYERFLLVTKDGITTEHVAGVATDFGLQIKTAIADTKATNDKIKRPVLDAGNMIQARANGIYATLEALLPMVEKRLKEFLDAKAKAEREVAEREAQHLAAAAQEALQAADRGGDGEVAIEALQAAQEAEARATASLPELSRVRSVHNSVAGLSDNWEYGITHPDLVPRQFLMVNDAAVKLAIKGGAREIPGLQIFNSPRLYSRKGR